VKLLSRFSRRMPWLGYFEQWPLRLTQPKPELLRTSHTQTNEVAHCATLIPAFACSRSPFLSLALRASPSQRVPDMSGNHPAPRLLRPWLWLPPPSGLSGAGGHVASVDDPGCWTS
jgi:hypothetical protein